MGAEVRLFGSIRVSVDGQLLGPRDFGGRKPKQLLEILALSSGRYVAKDRLAHLLWGENLPHDAAGSLQHYVSLLRRRLAPAGTRSTSLIVTDHGGYRLDRSQAWVDLTEFDTLYDAAIASSDRPAMEEALTLATGELLEDEPYTDWALTARRETAHRRLQLHVATGELALAEADHAAAAAHASDALAIDPLHEAAVRLLMTATYRAGEQSRALRVFEDFRRALAADVGADPMPATRALHQAVLRQSGAAGAVLEPASPPVPARAVPAVALPTQRGRDHVHVPEQPAGVRFVGRDQEVAACLTVHGGAARTAGLRSVVLDGEMGVGKSALLDELAARLAGQRVVRVTCTEHGRSVAGWLLEEVLLGLLAEDATVVHGLVDGLATGSREVTGTTGAAEAVGIEAAAPLPLATLRRLDLELAGAGPFAVLVDDADLADERSLQVLAALGRRRGAGRGTVVLAADVARLPHGHLLNRYAPDLRLLLEPLSRENLLALGLPDLHEPTGGLPLLVAGCATGQVSDQVSDRVLSRLRSGDEQTWRVVVACSVTAEPFGGEEVARLAGMDALEVAEIQQRLCRERVLVDAGEGYGFRYPLVRQIVQDTVPAGRRRVLARRLRSRPTGTDRRSRVGSVADGGERRAETDRRQAHVGHTRSSGEETAAVALPV
jgi:DNA-binding SARP family transcriptional activator